MTSTTHTAITITTMDQQSDSNNTAPAMNSDEMLLESAAQPILQVHHPLAGPAYGTLEDMLDNLKGWAKDCLCQCLLGVGQ